jgi:hypothetical protein
MSEIWDKFWDILGISSVYPFISGGYRGKIWENE